MTTLVTPWAWSSSRSLRMALSVICPFQNHHSTIPYSAVLPVPEPPQHHSVFGGGSEEVGGRLARGRHGDLLPGALGGNGGERQQNGRKQEPHGVSKGNIRHRQKRIKHVGCRS